GQVFVEKAIEAMRLLAKAFNGIGQFFRRIVAEMAKLTKGWPLRRHLPHHPLQNMGSVFGLAGEKSPDLFRQINQNGAGLSNTNRLATLGGGGINDCRNTVVGADGQKGRGELFAIKNIDGYPLAVKTHLLNGDGDFVDIGSFAIKD